MKKFSITLFYRGVSIKADCAEAAESLFKELFEIYGTDVFDSCDIVATEIEKEEYKMLNCTLLEYYMDNILKLSDDELQQVITAIEKEQNERKNKRKQELVNRASGRFEIYAIVPTRITPAELKRLKASKVGIRVSIEPTGMGLYKSFAYEIFKRRPSVVVALDGNSAGANTIQEANNGKKKARIFVYHGARVLNTKARMIQGYVTVFKDEAITERILLAVDKVFGEMNKG